jgi:acyl dehydratase
MTHLWRRARISGQRPWGPVPMQACLLGKNGTYDDPHAVMDTMVKKVLDVRKYAMADQQGFAELSGDFNPVHLDPVRARRECFGDVIVHGIHGVLRALDAYLATLRQRGMAAVALKKLTGRFVGPIYLNQRVETSLVDEQDGRAKLQTRHSEQLLLEVELQWITATDAPPNGLPAAPPSGQGIIPLEVSPDELRDRRGKLDLYINPGLASAEFPNLAMLTSLRVLAEILALTRLVGMECPGLRSIFKAFDLDFYSPTSMDGSLVYEVTRTDPRFSMAKIALYGASMSGTVDAFSRPPPQRQPDITDLQEIVDPSEFGEQCALIVGGSRGLGEVTAKIVAAGGGHPIITYHRGLEDAERVACEIKAAGGVCEILQCDVSRPKKAIAQMAKLGHVPSHLYYFASPKIFINKGEPYNTRLFRTFASFYVDGLFKTYQACRSFWSDKLFMFYPSSTALDEKVKDLAEYSTAKAAGEALCGYLDHFDRKLSIVVKRLPRIATDQTMTLLHYPAASALEVMIEIVRQLNTKAI